MASLFLRLVFAWFAAVLFCGASARAAEAVSPHPALSLAPIPDWVAPPLDAAKDVALAEEQTADLDYLVSERQVLVSRRSSFVRYAYRVASAAGLSDAAELSFAFDPGYETIAFHHVRVIRGGRTEERLALSDFDVIRQERDRERLLYDGRLTAILQLREVRVGDVIYYDYTIN